MTTTQWVHRPQEVQKWDYWFSWNIYVSKGVNQLLSQKAIQTIIEDVRFYAEANKGLGNLVIYLNKETDQKLFFIDSLSKEEFKECYQAQNYATLLLEQEASDYYTSIKEY